MAKLQAGYPGTTTHTDIIQLLHDEVVSLCQKNYNTVSGLEIDGIICISILDTKEQQVVKIHKTLKSVFADNKKKTKRQKTHEQPSYWLNGNLGNTGFPVRHNTNGPENFQNDINALSNLLRDTNAAIRRDTEEKSGEESVSKQSKRKRRQPKQRVTNNIEPIVDGKKLEESHETNSNVTPLLQENSYHDSPGINPFIHKDVIKVKEEKVDPEYEAAEQTRPKIVNVSSVSESDKDKAELNESGVEKTKVSSLIDRIIEKEIPRGNSEDKTILPDQEKDNFDKEVKDIVKENGVEDNCEFQAIEVKVEKNTDESEYGGSQGCDAGDFTGASSDNVLTGDSNSETENFECPPDWLYNERSSLSEVGRSALLDKLHEKGSVALTGYPRERGRSEPDPQGRSWIEMVKDNVSKYQAALERSGKGRTEGESDISDTGSTVQTSALAKSSSSLVALLKKPSVASSQPKEVTSNAILDSVRNSRGSSVPIQDTDQISDRSTSASPMIKIEVDENMTHEVYSQSDGEVNDDKNRVSNLDMSQDVKDVMAKAPQGKLESRYPALFSHLQQAKQQGTENQDQSDSLVNRLPFISFQELFSQAASGAPSPRLSESTTMQLLAQARINPYPSKEKHKGQRKVWNWKKRQVRPRDADGKIISPIPVNLKAQKETSKKRHHFGFHSSLKKTFSKRGPKCETEQDKDWQPEIDHIDVDSDNNENAAIGIETEGTPGRRTRLSCGEKPRINFAELDNSDIEIDDDDDDDDEDMAEVSALQGSIRKKIIDTMNPLIYTDRPGDSNSVFPGGGSDQLLAAFSASSEQLNSASSSASEQYKCSLCGLEFNQEYRWHYHLIKVHGITADKVNLFR